MPISRIRVATLDDIEMLVCLGFQFLPKTPYRNLTPDPDTARRWIEHVILTGVVIIVDEDSFICGVTIKLPFATQTIASELMWGSTKNGLRRTRVEKELLEAFEYWARNIAQADAIQIGSFHGDKFLSRRGYERCETLYMAELK